ncbi:VF530 family DNA-binding protein [Schlesneria sp. DSM 10557]|uniref:VF530 family protein n=1 Tax=Schlesneria sp. DSM 10557 TaxID=3044399 RepID=UPI0035C7DFD8
MTSTHPNDPLHGVTLAVMLERLEREYGWDGLAQFIPVRCFLFDPSMNSSLRFLRKTPWARAKVEALYLRTVSDEAPNGENNPS